jgi:hypothetical protein
MGFVVESDRTLLAVISHDVDSVGQGESKGDQHCSYYQFLHGSLLVVSVE